MKQGRLAKGRVPCYPTLSYALLHSGGLKPEYLIKAKNNLNLSFSKSLFIQCFNQNLFIYPSPMVYDNCALQQKRCRKPLVRLFSRG